MWSRNFWKTIGDHRLLNLSQCSFASCGDPDRISTTQRLSLWTQLLWTNVEHELLLYSQPSPSISRKKTFDVYQITSLPMWFYLDCLFALMWVYEHDESRKNIQLLFGALTSFLDNPLGLLIANCFCWYINMRTSVATKLGPLISPSKS